MNYCPPNEAVRHMTEDAALLEAAENGQSGWRVYFWDTPAVTLGRFQKPEIDLVDPSKIPYSIRPTGGKAVLHGHDLTFALAMPLAFLNCETRSVKQVYRALTRPMIEALRACGLHARLAEDTPFANKGPRVADCFAHISANDIVEENTGLKVCGCALRLTQNAVLLQASIPITEPQVEPSDWIPGAKKIQVFSWNHRQFSETFAVLAVNGTNQ